MKTKLTIILLALLAFSSCKKKASDTTVEDEAVSIELEATPKELKESEDLKTCDDFLDNYEKWMDNYIELLSKHKDNPLELATSKEYIETMSQASDWMMKWVSKHGACAQNSEYADRMKDIQEKGDKKLKEIGMKK